MAINYERMGLSPEFVNSNRETYTPWLSLPELGAFINQESGYDPLAVSSAGATGLMQLMPGTAKEMGVRDINNAEQNYIGGLKYLQKSYAKHGNPREALMGYFGGINGKGTPHWGPKTEKYPNAILGPRDAPIVLPAEETMVAQQAPAGVPPAGRAAEAYAQQPQAGPWDEFTNILSDRNQAMPRMAKSQYVQNPFEFMSMGNYKISPMRAGAVNGRV